MKKKILLIGEAMASFVSNNLGELSDVKDFSLQVAGAELNVAIGLTRLGYEVEYVTKLGVDPLSVHIQEYIKKNNIGDKYITNTNKHNVGLMLKGKTDVGDPKVYYYRKNSAANNITIEDVENIDLSEFGLLHITGISFCVMRQATLYLLEKAKKENILVTFDPNLRLTMWDSREEMIKLINEVSQKADVVIPGINEANILVGSSDIEEINKKYLAMNVNKLVVKDGEKGSHFFKDGQHVFEKGFVVDKVVDTVGAGDGFAVGVISSLLENLSMNDLLIRSNAIGSIQVQHVSDNEGLPTREYLEEYIRRNR